MIVGIYTRVSTQEQAQEGFSIREQEDRLRKYCDAMNWTIYRVYSDPAFSGSNMERPALRAMIRDVESGLLQKILVYKLDRLSRSQLDTLYLIERVFLAHNVDFVSMTENFDTSTPLGRAMIGILSVFAQLEREQIKERMIMGQDARARQGLHHGSFAPRGYKYEPETDALVVDPIAAEYIRKIFRMFCERYSLKAIKREMESTTDLKWATASIAYILNNRVYLGYIPHKGTWTQGKHTPIIDDVTFQKTQEILQERSTRHHENHRDGKATSLLAGMLICGRCGAKYTALRIKWNDNQKSYAEYMPCYECNSRAKRTLSLIKDPNCKNKIWKQQDLESLVFGEVRKLKLIPPEKRVEPKEDHTEEIKKIDAQLERLMDLYTLGGISLESVETRVSALNEKRQILSARQEEVSKRPVVDHTSLIQSFDDVLRLGNHDEIREVLITLIDRIIIDGENLEIHWNL